MPVEDQPRIARHGLSITGLVQGVGFRPFVWRLAVKHGLSGLVRNQQGGVCIEVEGDSAAVEQFCAELTATLPPLARIDSIQRDQLSPRGELTFEVVSSAGALADENFISPDVATCNECLAELFDPTNRRYLHPFINCTNCGPRLTIIRDLPYDRANTVMAAFPMCAKCRAEYEDPASRRFHAEPIACPECGPKLAVLDAGGNATETSDPIGWTAQQIQAGRIGAVKGLGGFHLVCDARSGDAVAELRRRKGRDDKPFAVMFPNLETAREYCDVSDLEASLIGGRERPIVLVKVRDKKLAEGISPGNPMLGVMLPYTPVHHLLMRGLSGMPLVMTSGNRSDTPMVFEDTAVVAELKEVVDFLLTHDRAIEMRCDDSVMRMVGREVMPMRRARGYAPMPMPMECDRQILAVGAQMKSTVAWGRGGQAVVSHHLGDLEHYEAFVAFTKAIGHFENIYRFRPELIVHDLHPDYASTRYAVDRGAREGAKCVAVQHHHAHIASCLAEHGRDERVIGVAFDGTGLGTNGAVWGGEFLIADCASFERAGHLRYVAMPGREAAVREPWRMALAHLTDANEPVDEILKAVPPQTLAMVSKALASGFNAPKTSSAGRLFDAVAALIGVRREVSYEGQAAMELEWLAMRCPVENAYPFAVGEHDSRLVIDTREMVNCIAHDLRKGMARERIARDFHSTMAGIIVTVCTQLRQRTGLASVVLSGGVFMNAILTLEASERLNGAGFNVLRHAEIPTNDGGISFGQLAIAAARERLHS